MSHESAYPYTLDIQPCDRPVGHFRWIIRERGKLLQRSDRAHHSEEAALKSGRSELARIAAAGRTR
jgi:hypothetical protein